MYRHHFATRFLLVTVTFASMYGLLHATNRSFANDMPHLLATQAAKQLDAGLGLSSIQMGATDLANNPIPFVVIYDKKEKAVAGSGYLNRTLAQMPKGVVEHATPGRPHAVTWAPRSDIRIASVTVAAKDYYVVGGQSLKITENRSKKLLLFALAGYGTAVFIMVAVRFCQCKTCRTARAESLDLHGTSCTCAMCQKSPAPIKKVQSVSKKKTTVKTKQQTSRK